MTKEESIFIDRKFDLELAVNHMAHKLGHRRAACAVWDTAQTLLIGLREQGVKNSHLDALQEFLLKEWPCNVE